MSRSVPTQSRKDTELPSAVKPGELSYHRLVVKLGSNLLTGDDRGLNVEVMSSLVGQLARLHRENAEVIVVSSGAIASGRGILRSFAQGAKHRGAPMRQVLASVGQSRLMQTYDKLFADQGITVAQALVSRGDLTDRSRYLNVRNALSTLVELGVVPIVNENDVVAVDEIRGAHFGDNDNLSAMVANLVDADLLMVLTDTAGLYTSDPHLYEDAELIRRVEVIDEKIEAIASGTRNPSAVGGMVTKVQAARLATSSGIDVAVADGHVPDVIVRLAGGESLGTLFPSLTTRKESRKRWMLTGLSSQGTIQVDQGAAGALKQGGKSLLPAGVVDVEGEFRRGDLVDIMDPSGRRIACGLTNYATHEVGLIKGVQSSAIEGLLGTEYGEEIVHRNNLVLL